MTTYDFVALTLDANDDVVYIPVMEGLDCLCALKAKLEMMGKNLSPNILFGIFKMEDDKAVDFLAYVKATEDGIEIEWKNDDE